MGTLAAFAALGRIAFAAVPNVKPTTDIVLIAGFALGGGPGFAVGAIAGLSSNFFFGQGPWTPWQMAAWGATGVIGAGAGCARVGLRRRRRPRRDRRSAAGRWRSSAASVGFAFTAVQDVGDWVTYSDHSWASSASTSARGSASTPSTPPAASASRSPSGPALTALDPALRAPAGGHLAAGRAAGRARRGADPRRRSSAVRAGVAGVTARPGRRRPRPATCSAPRTATAASAPRAGQPSNPLYAGWAALGLASAGYDLNDVARGRPRA